MKVKATLLWNLLFALASLHAQNFEWARSFDGVMGSKGNSICVDASGNVYTTGSFEGTVDFDPGAGTANLTAVNSRDIFVQKWDAFGNFLWARSFGGSSLESGVSISVDNSGNVYTTGYFRGSVDFDTGTGTTNLISAGNTDIFVQKLDPSGQFLWARSFGSSSYEGGLSISVDAWGNVYTTGYFNQTVDFEPGTGTTNLTAIGVDIFVQKMDASGNFLWARSFGGTGSDEGNSISVDAWGNVYTMGGFSDTVDFDPGSGTAHLTSMGSQDIFVQKMDSSGNFLWAKSFGSSNGDIGLSISVDDSGNVYTTGYFRGSVDFDPGTGTTNLTSAGNADIFVQKLDAYGNFLWARSIGSATNELGLSISEDASGNVYATGYFSDTVDFDPGPGTANLTAAGDRDIFVLKMDASGNFLWARSFGGTFFDRGNSISVDTSGNVYTTGSFEGTVDFDPGTGTAHLTSGSDRDIFVLKMSCTPSTSTDVQTACYSYTWIDGKTYTSSNNTATDTIFNATGSGCDSIVTLDLTINTVSDTNISLSGLTLTATNTNATYQWLDCDNNYALIGGETNQSYTATANGNYAVELNENGCVDTSACVEITNVGIFENDSGDDLQIYPNPSQGNYSIDLGQVYPSTEISIADLKGQLIRSLSFQGEQVIGISIAEPAGVYLITIISDDKKAILRLVKK